MHLLIKLRFAFLMHRLPMEQIFQTVILLYQNTFLQYCLRTFKTVMVLYTHVIFEKKIYVCRERDVPVRNMGMISVPFTLKEKKFETVI
jgi:hypothetical protein